MLGKRLINSNSAAAGGSCTTDTLNILGDSPNSCVAYYKMSDSTDESGSYDGTATNVNFNVAGKFGNAGSFNGSSSKILAPTSFTNTQDVSISLWAQGVVAPSSSYRLFFQGGGNDYFYIGVESDGEVYAYPDNYQDSVYPRYSTKLSTSNSGVTDGGWHHIVVVNKIETSANGGGYKIYVDGTLNASASFSSTLRRNSGQSAGIGIGSGNTGTYAFFEGKIDQVRIFNKAILSTEVTTLYNEVDCACTTNTINYPTTNVAYYEFDGNAEDSTTNGYNGTLSNITWAQGRYGTVGSFNGSSSFLDTNYTLPAISAYSISVWLKTSATNSQQFVLADFNSVGSGLSVRFTLGFTAANKWYFSLGNGSSNWSDYTINALPYRDGNWHNIVTVWNGTSVKLYADGNTTPIVDLTSSFAAGTAGTSSLVMGRAGDYAGNYWNGSIDQVRIFSSALSITDVADLYDEQYCFDNFFNDDSTVATYKLNNTPFDDLGHYNGTASNVTYATGKFDEAAVFNGTSTKINILPPISTTSDQDFSFSQWVNFDVLPTSGSFIGIWGSDTGLVPTTRLLIRQVSGGYRYEVLRAFNSSYYYNANGSTDMPVSSLSTSVWYNIVFTYTSSTKTVHIYLNGVELGTGYVLSTSASATISTGLSMGRYNSGSLYGLDGKLDNVRIFDRVLSSAEVTQLYNE